MFLNISLPHTTYMLNMLQLLNPLTQWMRGTGTHTILKFYDTETCSQNSFTLNLQLDNNLYRIQCCMLLTLYTSLKLLWPLWFIYLHPTSINFLFLYNLCDYITLHFHFDGGSVNLFFIFVHLLIRSKWLPFVQFLELSKEESNG